MKGSSAGRGPCEHRRVRTMLISAALSVLLAGCASTPVPVRVVAPGEGYVISFPGRPESAIGRDGPVDYRIDAMRTLEGARFEMAWFRFPQMLDPEERLELMKRIELGLLSPGARVASRVETPPGNKDRLDLIIDHADGRRGYHRILYPSGRAMIQVSAVGPKGGDWEQIVPGFLMSLELTKRGPYPELPVSARLDLR